MGAYPPGSGRQPWRVGRRARAVAAAALCMVLLPAPGPAGNAAAQGAAVRLAGVLIDGRRAGELPVRIEGGRLFAPVTPLAAFLGFGQLDAAGSRVRLLTPAGPVELVAGQATARLGSIEAALPAPPRRLAGELWVPVRPLAEWNGFTVVWDGLRETVGFTRGLPLPVFLAGVQVDAGPDETVVTLHLSGEASYHLAQHSAPPKIVLELPGTAAAGVPPVIGGDDPAVTRVRVAALPGPAARVVLDLGYQLPPPAVRWEQEPGRLVVTVPKRFVEGWEARLAPGVQRGHQRRGLPDGPVLVDYLRVDLGAPGVAVRPARAGGERVSGLAGRAGALAGINGGFFTGQRALGLLLVDGVLLDGPVYGRTALGLGPGGRWRLEPVNVWGFVRVGETGPLLLDGVNRPTVGDELLLFTPAYGSRTGTAPAGRELVVEGGRVTEVVPGNARIPPEGFVVAARGRVAARLERAGPGDYAYAYYRLEPDWPHLGIRYGLGAGPRLVAGGRIQITSEAERFRSDVTEGRAPRSAAGITARGELLLVVASGRRPGESVGLTLEELAQLMVELGSIEALNLDGGGSSTLVVNGDVVNAPADGQERTVANALLVFAGSEEVAAGGGGDRLPAAGSAPVPTAEPAP